MLFLAFVSVPLWVVFELYNKYSIHNWHYAFHLAVRGAARVDIIRGSVSGRGIRSASVATAEQRSWQDVHDIARA